MAHYHPVIVVRVNANLSENPDHEAVFLRELPAFEEELQEKLQYCVEKACEDSLNTAMVETVDVSVTFVR